MFATLIPPSLHLFSLCSVPCPSYSATTTARCLDDDDDSRSRLRSSSKPSPHPSCGLAPRLRSNPDQGLRCRRRPPASTRSISSRCRVRSGARARRSSLPACLSPHALKSLPPPRGTRAPADGVRRGAAAMVAVSLLVASLATLASAVKYFTEPCCSYQLGHYDKRYFKAKLDYKEYRPVLRDLIRSYLITMDAYGVETWLAHGTLLGWWWNGQIMPWDTDLDVQVSNATMNWMGTRLNRTEHVYNVTNTGPGKPDERTYMLDVNPHHVELARGNGHNIIDARWIDTTSAMFIDITSVRQRNPSKPGLFACKNHHNYQSQDLWPMRISEFEGIRARIPYNFEGILTKEYGAKCLVAEEYSGHKWNANLKEWVLQKPGEEKKAFAAAAERKKKELIRQGRLRVQS
ncbi:hypothetical protein RJ55_06677 [Drechmeria coniospora]|nr:hypothetical protein RJ55_06677 [Drechmeria coniospora]